MRENNGMTYEQKLQALQALGVSVKLHMRVPGDWYVSAPIERVEDGCMGSRLANGVSPEAAVHDYWAWATRHPTHKVLCVGGKRYTWCRGTRWSPYP